MILLTRLAFQGKAPLPQFGLFGGGGSTSVLNTDKYIFDTDVVSPGTNLTGSAPAYAAGVGTKVFGLFCGGFTSTYIASTIKYTYQGNTVAAGAALGTPLAAAAGVGNNTLGIIGAGSQSSGVTNTTYTNIYTYGTNVVTPGVVLGMARSGSAGVGIAAYGIIAGGSDNPIGGTGFNRTYTDRYTYAANTVAPATVLAINTSYTAGLSSATRGIICSGSGTNIYTYASNVVTTGTTMPNNRQYLKGTSSSIIGLIAGSTGGTRSVDKYTFAGDVISSGSLLAVVKSYLSATSSAPGGI